MSVVRGLFELCLAFIAMSNNSNYTFYQWHNHFDVLEREGYNPLDLEFIRLVVVSRINDRQDLTGEMLFNVTMADVGFGSLSSVLLVNDRLGSSVDGIPIPRQLIFGDPEVPNPYDDVWVEEEDPSQDFPEWEEVEPLMVHVVETDNQSHVRGNRVRVVPVWI